jgi:alcohol dehydrogenase class IV
MNILKTYNFRIPRNILFGINAVEQVGERAKELGGSKALLVTDKVLHQTGAIGRVKEKVEKSGIDVVVYDEVTTEPTTEHVDEGSEVLRADSCDLVIALGGGSCIDAGKVIAMLATNPGRVTDYEGKGKVKKAKCPMIAIPTTAGTGSELTWVAVIHDSKRDVKFLVYSPYLVPEECIEDPILTVAMPKSVTMSSGMDALTHAIEGYISTRDANVGYGSPPIIEFLAIPAIELITINLRKAWADGQNIEARSNMLLAQLLAGMTFGNSGTALVHGLARPLGAHFHVPHGLANAVMLAHGVEYTYMAAPEKFARIARAMGENTEKLGVMEAAEKTISAVNRLCKDLCVPKLRELGIDKETYFNLIPAMAREGMESGTPLVNPRKPTEEDMMELFEKAY